MEAQQMRHKGNNEQHGDNAGHAAAHKCRCLKYSTWTVTYGLFHHRCHARNVIYLMELYARM